MHSPWQPSSWSCQGWGTARMRAPWNLKFNKTLLKPGWVCHCKCEMIMKATLLGVVGNDAASLPAGLGMYCMLRPRQNGILYDIACGEYTSSKTVFLWSVRWKSYAEPHWLDQMNCLFVWLWWKISCRFEEDAIIKKSVWDLPQRTQADAGTSSLLFRVQLKSKEIVQTNMSIVGEWLVNRTSMNCLALLLCKCYCILGEIQPN